MRSDTLYFDSGSATLDTQAVDVLERFVAPINASDRLYLTAHTDAVGLPSFNEDLARRRAETAQNLLQAKWPKEATVIQTFGERTPVADNETDQGRQRNRRVTLDYFREVPFLALNGQVLSQNGNRIPNAKVLVRARAFTDTIQTDSSGRYTLALPTDSIVGIDVYAKGYFLATKMLKVRPPAQEQLQITLPKADIGAIADIANLYFVGDKAVLLERSAPELPRVKRFMEVNPHLIVEIAGHVNFPHLPPVTENTFPWDLSVRRAKLVYDYLLQEGIPAEQLTYRGYGNHEMRFPKANTAAEQEANRRVEIRVIGELD